MENDVTTQTATASVGRWLRHLSVKAADQPWTGPRPLRPGEGDCLIGRDDTIQEVAKRLRTHRLLHLIGVSGVGKSSMLMAGLVPKLRDAGYTVAYCRTWDLRQADFVDHVAHALYESLQEAPAGGRTFTDGKAVYLQLEELQGTGVIILDQFEEFLRGSSESIRDAFEFLIALHQEFSVRIILSYRSEYLYALKELDRDPRISGTYTVTLPPLEKRFGIEVIRSPRRPSAAPRGWVVDDIIDSEAAEQIHRLWSDAPPFRDGSGEVGPLHLQALLTVLDTVRGEGPIDRGVLSGYLARALDEHGPTRGPGTGGTRQEPDRRELADRAMRFALEESASIRLEQAQQAARAIGLNEHAIRGATALLARMVPHLSSGGYKVSQQVHELAGKVLADEIDQLRDVVGEELAELEARGLRASGVADADAGEIAEAAVKGLILTLTNDLFDGNEANDGELLTSSRGEILHRAMGHQWWESGDRGRLMAEVDWPKVFGLPDRRYGSAGPLLGFGPLQVLIEQLRRFAWALAWLAHLSLATVSGGRDESAVVWLIHDGFGPALKRWSTRFEDANATTALYSVATQPGLSHNWRTSGGSDPVRDRRYAEDLSGDERSPRFHFNLGFRGNVIIGAQFEHAVFVNCEFTGTVFIGCRFSSVTFLNCRLDGALFDGCTIGGGGDNLSATEPLTPASQYTSVPLEELVRPAVYSLGNPGNAAELMARYRERGEVDVSAVVAQPPGRPAMPVTAAVAAQLVAWAPSGKGLIIHGCRVSAIIMRGLVFEGERVLFRRVRGSGVEVGELRGFVAIDVMRSAIRHLTLSTARSEQDTPVPCTLDLRVEDAIAAQWWIGDGFEGRVSAKGSRLGQLWVSSPGVSIELDETCQSTGLVTDQGVGGQRLAARDASVDLASGSADEVTHFLRAAAAMDYRQRPESTPTVIG